MLKKDFVTRTLILCILCLQLIRATYAEVSNDYYQPNVVISNDKTVRWTVSPRLPNIAKIDIVIQNLSNKRESVIYLSFGEPKLGEQLNTYTVTGVKPSTIIWNVDSIATGNKPFTIKIIEGSVKIISVNIAYKTDITKNQSPLISPVPNESSQRTTRKKTLCKLATPYIIPRISIKKVAPIINSKKPYYNISGSIAGNCISEAGYFEGNELIQKITIEFTDISQVTQFNVNASINKKGEIIVRTSTEQESKLNTDELIETHKTLFNFK